MPEDRIDLQNAEFRAAEEFSKQLGAILATPVVDDDYPQQRHYYERAVRELIKAFEANGRIPK